MFLKLCSIFLVMFLVVGCSTMKPIDMPPEQVQQKISAGEVLGVGDAVKLTTKDNEVHEFKVTSLTDKQVLGENIEIAIDDIVAIETKQFSAGRTAAAAAAAGGTVLLWIIVGALLFGGTLAL